MSFDVIAQGKANRAQRRAIQSGAFRGAQSIRNTAFPQAPLSTPLSVSASVVAGVSVPAGFTGPWVTILDPRVVRSNMPAVLFGAAGYAARSSYNSLGVVTGVQPIRWSFSVYGARWLMRYSAGAGRFRIWVNDVPHSIVTVPHDVNDGAARYVIIDHGSVAHRSIVVEGEVGFAISHIAVETNGSIGSPLSESKGRFAVLGDSISLGTGAYPLATTLSGALATGAAITVLPVVALTAAIGTGTIVVVRSGTAWQWWTLTAPAAVGATSLAVASQIPGFAYPTGSLVELQSFVNGWFSSMCRLLGIRDSLQAASVGGTGFIRGAASGYGDFTTPGRLQADVISLAPDAVIITATPNDFVAINAEGKTLADLDTAVRSTIAQLRAGLPNAVLMICGSLNAPYSTGAYVPMNDQVRTTAAALGVAYIETVGWLSSTAFTGDGTHPNKLGHDQTARNMAPRVAPLLGLTA